MAGGTEALIGRTGLEHLAAVHEHQVGGQAARHRQIVSGHDQADAIAGQRQQFALDGGGGTRVMTTAIALETSKGDLPLALALGLLLVLMVLVVNLAAHGVRAYAAHRHG